MNLENLFRQRWSELLCLYPVYSQGNATAIRFFGQEDQVHNIAIKTVKRRLTKSFGIDPGARRHLYGHLVKGRQTAPLVINQDMILVPVKTRRSVGRDDGSWGYLVAGQVERVEPDGACSTIVFRDQSRLTGLIGARTVQDRLAEAGMVRQHYMAESHIVDAYAAAGGAAVARESGWEGQVMVVILPREEARDLYRLVRRRQ